MKLAMVNIVKTREEQAGVNAIMKCGWLMAAKISVCLISFGISSVSSSCESVAGGVAWLISAFNGVARRRLAKSNQRRNGGEINAEGVKHIVQLSEERRLALKAVAAWHLAAALGGCSTMAPAGSALTALKKCGGVIDDYVEGWKEVHSVISSPIAWKHWYSDVSWWPWSDLLFQWCWWPGCSILFSIVLTLFCVTHLNDRGWLLTDDEN